MAKKSGNGHGNDADATLADVVAELHGIGQILRGHGRQLTEVVGRLTKLEVTTAEGFADLRGRFDNLLERASERDRRLEERVAKLEARLPETR